jgi:cell division protein FtsN
MRELVRPVASALGLAWLVASMAILSTGSALAQAKQAPPQQQSAPKQAAPPPAPEAPLKQVALTEKQIEGVLAAAREMDPITEKLPEDGKPDPKIIAQLDGVARKNGLASYDEYNDVIDNISIVLAGFDPATRKYVGDEAVIKAQIAKIQADNKLPAKDKTEVLADLDAALKSPGPAIENKGNIDLVAKYYDKLAEVLGEED